MKCLLVDDEPGIREGLAALLRKQGHDVRTAGDCAGARGALVDDFDVVVTDWRLPDGTADAYWAAARCPVVAVSGHPEEVVRDAQVHAVLTKPATPAKLLAVLATVPGLAPASPPGAALPLPIDVQRAIAAFVQQLPAGTTTETWDDGTFVTVVAGLDATAAPKVQSRHGELSLRRREGAVAAQLRLRRDGRPAAPLPVIAPLAPWPLQGSFAVDFHDSALEPAALAACLERAAAVRRQGRYVQLLNLPDRAPDCAFGHGTADDMPMREPVGPSLQAEFADLWREP